MGQGPSAPHLGNGLGDIRAFETALTRLALKFPFQTSELVSRWWVYDLEHDYVILSEHRELNTGVKL